MPEDTQRHETRLDRMRRLCGIYPPIISQVNDRILTTEELTAIRTERSTWNSTPATKTESWRV